MLADTFTLWTVYEKPKDYPDKWVCRRWEMDKDDSAMLATSDVITGTSYAAVITALLSQTVGLVRIARDPSDDPCIVESWL